MGSSFGQFPETTPRSQHVGQPGYDTNADWCHFLDKYKARIVQFGRDHYPRYRDMAEDVFQTMIENIYSKPALLNYKPTIRYRSALLRLYRLTFADLLRDLRTDSRKTYLEMTAAAQEKTTSLECDQRRLQLLVLSMIRENLLSPDYPNGRSSAEYNTLDLDIWRALQEDGATYLSVSQQLGLSMWKVFSANKRIENRIVNEAQSLLSSQGLI